MYAWAAALCGLGYERKVAMCTVLAWLTHVCFADAGRKANKQKIGNVRLSVSDVVRNGKIRDSWALQASLLLLRGPLWASRKSRLH